MKIEIRIVSVENYANAAQGQMQARSDNSLLAELREWGVGSGAHHYMHSFEQLREFVRQGFAGLVREAEGMHDHGRGGLPRFPLRAW